MNRPQQPGAIEEEFDDFGFGLGPQPGEGNFEIDDHALGDLLGGGEPGPQALHARDAAGSRPVGEARGNFAAPQHR